MGKIRKNKEQVIKLLNDTIKEYITNDDLIWYRYHLNINGFSSSAYANWTAKGDEDIDELHDILEELQEARIVNGMLNKNSNIDRTTSIYYTKVHLNWVEREKLLAIEQKDTSLVEEAEVVVEFEVMEDDQSEAN